MTLLCQRSSRMSVHKKHWRSQWHSAHHELNGINFVPTTINGTNSVLRRHPHLGPLPEGEGEFHGYCLPRPIAAKRHPQSIASAHVPGSGTAGFANDAPLPEPDVAPKRDFQKLYSAVV